MAGTRDEVAMVAAGHTVSERIKSSARNTGQDAQFLFRRFALERLLVRLAETKGGGGWCLKGGMVMLTLGDDFRRPTEDLDVTTLAPFEARSLVADFQEIAAAVPDQEDGLTYAVDLHNCRVTREEAVNPGLRVMLDAEIRTRTSPVLVRLKIDAAYGEAITPAPRMDRLPPTCKGFLPPEVAVYPWETVVAEKLHAITKHGAYNTRIKDFYDLVAISRKLPFDGPTLSGAVSATFVRRGRPAVEAEPHGLTPRFAASKEADWKRFMAVRGLGTSIASMSEAITEIRAFALPMLAALAAGRSFKASWTPGRGWEALMPCQDLAGDIPEQFLDQGDGVTGLAPR